MRIPILLFAATVLLVFGYNESLLAQTVQLPEFHITSVQTSVLVPVGGSTSMGGFSRSGEYSTWRRGVPFFSNRNGARNSSRSTFRSYATLHDFEAMDRALLGSKYDEIMNAPPQNATGNSRSATKQSYGTRADTMSLAAIKNQQAAKLSATNQEAKKYVAHAEKALADGKVSVAKLFYRSALDKAQGQYKQDLLARLKALGQSRQITGK